jgi:hypothetical protein
MSNPTVQDAIDEAVAVLPDRLQQFEPTVENGIRSLVSAGVQRLLTNDPFRPLTTAALTSAHEQLVNGEAVEFTLGQAKERLPDSVRDGLAGQVLDLVPDDVGVTLLTPAESPQLYTAVDLLRSAWWWLGLVAAAAFVGALGVSRGRRRTLRAWAVTTTVLTLLLLVTLRVTRGLLLPQVRTENREAVGAMYDILAGSLRSWTLWLLVAVVIVLVLTLVWGRLGLVAGVRRGIAAARAQLAERREAARAARAEGAGEEAVPAEGQSWTASVAAWARGFADGLDVPERTASLGAWVRDHHDPARWAGIAVGALVLLFWPSPTVSVLVWVVALVALYVGGLVWLENRAPERPARAGEEGVAAGPVAVPAPRVGTSPGDGQPQPVGAVADAPRDAIPEPRGAEPLVSPALTPEALSTLSGRLDLLVRLGAARDAGVLTDEEFSQEKGRLLGV